MNYASNKNKMIQPRPIQLRPLAHGEESKKKKKEKIVKLCWKWGCKMI